MPAPMPLPPPVTITVWPAKSPGLKTERYDMLPPAERPFIGLYLTFT